MDIGTAAVLGASAGSLFAALRRGDASTVFASTATAALASLASLTLDERAALPFLIFLPADAGGGDVAIAVSQLEEVCAATLIATAWARRIAHAEEVATHLRERRHRLGYADGDSSPSSPLTSPPRLRTHVPMTMPDPRARATTGVSPPPASPEVVERHRLARLALGAPPSPSQQAAAAASPRRLRRGPEAASSSVTLVAAGTRAAASPHTPLLRRPAQFAHVSSSGYGQRPHPASPRAAASAPASPALRSASPIRSSSAATPSGSADAAAPSPALSDMPWRGTFGGEPDWRRWNVRSLMLSRTNVDGEAGATDAPGPDAGSEGIDAFIAIVAPQLARQGSEAGRAIADDIGRGRFVPLAPDAPDDRADAGVGAGTGGDGGVGGALAHMSDVSASLLATSIAEERDGEGDGEGDGEVEGGGVTRAGGGPLDVLAATTRSTPPPAASSQSGSVAAPRQLTQAAYTQWLRAHFASHSPARV